MKSIFDELSIYCSKKTTASYSTSFSLGTRFLSQRFRSPIHSIYGFVRFADEIVDSFHDYDQKLLLDKFWEDTHSAINNRISLNPILNSFQKVYHEFNFEMELVETFLKSMQMDLEKVNYSREEYETYILGSAQVVGLMCLKVFTEKDAALYNKLNPHAMSLGSAFQKINFLRDLKFDNDALGRAYFPHLAQGVFNDEVKKLIEKEISNDFEHAYQGIVQLPKDARFGVYVAFVYYHRLFKKIQNLSAANVKSERVRIRNQRKYSLLVQSYLRHTLNLL